VDIQLRKMHLISLSKERLNKKDHLEEESQKIASSKKHHPLRIQFSNIPKCLLSSRTNPQS
jgi:hypothetical protein